MAQIPNPEIDAARTEIVFQLQRRETLQAELEEQELWLERIASQFSSSEEQQRIVGDCLELKARIGVIDDRVRELQMVVDAGSGGSTEP
jgi:hypothetical protein